MSTQDTLNFISQQLHIYFGLFILIFGVIGGIFNVIIFTTLKTFRETVCGFYLTILSLVSTVQLLTGLLTRILSNGLYPDAGRISWVCKLQIYCVTWSLLVLMTITCLASIDQYVSMSMYRHYSNRRIAQRAVVLTCILWGLYCIPIAMYWDVSSGLCMIINPTFAIYSSRFHFPVVIGFLPLSTMTVFSLLAFHSARILLRRQINIVRLSRDRQLTAMTLSHVAFVVITRLPFTIYYIYWSNLVSQNFEQIARSNLIYSITLLIGYSSFAGSFYIYCCASERFRKQLLYVLTKICVDQQRPLNNNQVVPHIELEAIGTVQPIRTKRVAVEVISIE